MDDGGAHLAGGGKAFLQQALRVKPVHQATLFAQTNMAEQAKKLMQIIQVAVANLDNLERVRTAVEHLGRRHVEEYGVKEEHYDSGGTALLWTLEQGLGERFTAEAKEAWSEAYGLSW